MLLCCLPNGPSSEQLICFCITPGCGVGPRLNTKAAVDKPLGGAFHSASSRGSSCSLAPLLALTAQWDVQQKPAHAQGRRPVTLGLCSPGSLTAFAYQ